MNFDKYLGQFVSIEFKDKYSPEKVDIQGHIFKIDDENVSVVVDSHLEFTISKEFIINIDIIGG